MPRSCPHCKKPNATSARRCVHCAQTIASGISRGGRALHCPACLAPSHEVRLAAMELDVCERCAGVWLDRDELRQLPAAFSDEDMREAASAVLTALRSVPHGERGPAYPNCPVCQQAMVRRTYKQVSGLPLFHCEEHGTWAENASAVALFRLLGERTQQELEQRRETQRDDEFNRQLGKVRATERSLRARVQHIQTVQRWHLALDLLDIL